jgi:hypothetical protein
LYIIYKTKQQHIKGLNTKNTKGTKKDGRENAKIREKRTRKNTKRKKEIKRKVTIKLMYCVFRYYCKYEKQPCKGSPIITPSFNWGLQTILRLNPVRVAHEQQQISGFMATLQWLRATLAGLPPVETGGYYLKTPTE